MNSAIASAPSVTFSDEVDGNAASAIEQSQPQQQRAETVAQAAEDEAEDDEAAFVASVQSVSSLSELQSRFIAFYREREAATYALKNQFTEISRRQKEVFVEVENRRKAALAKGKKYKQATQKLSYQMQKLDNDLKMERKKAAEVAAELEVVRDQKQKREQAIEELTSNIQTLRSSLSQTEQSKVQMLDEFKQTHSVIDRLLQSEKMQEKLRCFVELSSADASTSPAPQENGHAKANGNGNGKKGKLDNCNLCIATLRFYDDSVDTSRITVQWKRSYYTQLLPIKNATKAKYMLSSDDIGSILKVEVRSKDNPDCYETALLPNGPVKMADVCARTAENNLLKISKQHLEFTVEPDLSDANTLKLLGAAMKSAKSKFLVLHLNKDKVKLRTLKNSTIGENKDQYNDAMKVSLSALNPNRFSLRLSRERKYVFFTKTPLQRDNIAILLRCYIERLNQQRHGGSLLCNFYLRLNNERTNYAALHKKGAADADTLTRDQLVSKILAPISSNPGLLNSLHMSPMNSLSMTSPQSLPSLLAPMQQGVNAPASNEPSLTNEADGGYDVGALFPDFGGDQPAQAPPTEPTQPQTQPTRQRAQQSAQPQTQPSDSKTDEVEFDAEELAEVEAQQHAEKAKKVWKNLEFVENATIASEKELEMNAIVPAPMSKTGKKATKRTKKKKKKKAAAAAKKTESKEAPTKEQATKPPPKEQAQAQSECTELTAEISDRIDCLLNAQGEVSKSQVVGTLILKYTPSASDTEQFVSGTIVDLESTKQSLFNPNNTEQMGQKNRIRVKLPRGDADTDKERSIEVLKYVWAGDSKKVEQSLPFVVRLDTQTTQHETEGQCLAVAISIVPNGSYAVKELSITGQLKEAVTACVTHSQLDDVDFIWSKELATKFMWNLKQSQIEQGKDYALQATFKGASEAETEAEMNHVKLKIQFEIQDSGITTVHMQADPEQSTAKIVRTVKAIRSGEFILR